MKIIRKVHFYNNAKGEKQKEFRFYVVLDNGNNVRISPYYYKSKDGKKDWNTFSSLSLISECTDDEE